MAIRNVLRLATMVGLVASLALGTACKGGGGSGESGKSGKSGKSGESAEKSKGAEGSKTAKGSESGDESGSESAEGSAGSESAGGGSGAERLTGTWSVDVEAIKQSEKFQNMPKKKRKMAEGMLDSMLADATMSFDGEQMTMNMAGKKQKATYEVIDSSGDSMTLETTEKGSGKTQKVDLSFDGEKLIFKPQTQGKKGKSPMNELVLVRESKDPNAGGGSKGAKGAGKKGGGKGAKKMGVGKKGGGKGSN